MNKTQTFIIRANIKHNNKYDYSKTIYVRSKDKIFIICPIHGEFEQMPFKHLTGQGCSKCGIETIKKTLRKTTEQFIEEAKIVHGEKYIYDKVRYINNHTNISIGCCEKNHGYFNQLPYEHLTGSGCSKCGTERTKNYLKKTTDQFIEEAKIVHGEKYIYDKVDYINKSTEILIGCFEENHGYFSQLPFVHLKGHGCPKCVYKNEMKAILYLEKLTNEQFIKCRPNFLKGLELDGFNVNLKLAIEYNYVPFFHRNGPMDLVKQKERDLLKEKLCLENNIYLITVPFWTHNIELFVKNEYENYLFLQSYNLN